MLYLSLVVASSIVGGRELAHGWVIKLVDIFYAYLMMLWVNMPIQIAQQRTPTAALHVYRMEHTMPAPKQSFIDDTMHGG